MKTEWSNVSFYYHPVFLEHLVGVHHPESPERLKSILSYLQKQGIYEKLDVRMPKTPDLFWIEKIHPYHYIQKIKNSCGSFPTVLDGGDTIVTEKSYQAAILAAGCVMDAVDALFNGEEAHHAFCAVRPPGHHAERNSAIGFCLFNNIAIGAQYAISRHGLERIFILDWDVHHGNGTQHIFEEQSNIYYCSLHQWPLFPGTGRQDERGIGKGKGFTLNIPLPPNTGHDVYLKTFRDNVMPAIKNFQADLIMISCGFDAHQADPLANLNLTAPTYTELTRLIAQVAKSTSCKKTISVLEGGYNLQELPKLVETHLEQLAMN
jgi:acetoin utilization deacetylase AcuC-like enzyme